MKFHHNGEADESPVNMTTLVDVVFILLSFFVLTAKFGHERDVTVGSEPPMAGGVQSGDLPERIIVRLTAAADAGAHSAPRIVIGETTLADLPSITAKLNEINLPAVPVVVAADERLSVDQVSRAMDAVLASSMKRLSLAGIGPKAGER